jgi:hypothetical protein
MRPTCAIRWVSGVHAGLRNMSTWKLPSRSIASALPALTHDKYTLTSEEFGGSVWGTVQRGVDHRLMLSQGGGQARAG